MGSASLSALSSKRFVGNLQYLMTAGKKPSTDLDLEPATYPPKLDLKKELAAASHPGDAPVKDSRKRKRLTFDEVSNVVIEGVGDGPLRKVTDLEAAARSLKHQGKVELWNYLGSLKVRVKQHVSWPGSGSFRATFRILCTTNL